MVRTDREAVRNTGASGGCGAVVRRVIGAGAGSGAAGDRSTSAVSGASSICAAFAASEDRPPAMINVAKISTPTTPNSIVRPSKEDQPGALRARRADAFAGLAILAADAARALRTLAATRFPADFMRATGRRTDRFPLFTGTDPLPGKRPQVQCYRSKGTAGPETASWSAYSGEDAPNDENRDTQYRDPTLKPGWPESAHSGYWAGFPSRRGSVVYL